MAVKELDKDNIEYRMSRIERELDNEKAKSNMLQDTVKRLERELERIKKLAVVAYDRTTRH